MGELVQLKQSSNVVMDWLGQFKSEKTIETYRISVEGFFGCRVEDISEWRIKGVKVRDVQEWIKGLFDNGMSDCSVKTKKAALSSLFEHCIDEEIIKDNVWIDRRIKKLCKVNMKKGEECGKSIGKEEIIELLNRIGDKYEKLLIGIMFKTGVRVSEVVEIKYSDIEKRNDCYWLRIVGKGRKIRYVCINEDLVREIEKYMDSYKIEDKLFSVSVRQVDRILKKWIDLSCHDCRRSFAINYIENGGILTDLQRILGHDRLETTRKYLIEHDRFNKRMVKVIDW